MTDPHQHLASRLDSPARRFEAVVPSDTSNLPTLPRFLVIGGGGVLSIMDERGVVSSISVAAGVVPLMPMRILATGTTATQVLACW